MATSVSEPKTIRLQPLRLRLSSSQQTLLKWLAMALMLLDHANRTLWTFQPWAFALGRIAFPLFAFLLAYNLIVRGVRPERYLMPLLLFGVTSQAPTMLALDRDVLPLNISSRCCWASASSPCAHGSPNICPRADSGNL